MPPPVFRVPLIVLVAEDVVEVCVCGAGIVVTTAASMVVGMFLVVRVVAMSPEAAAVGCALVAVIMVVVVSVTLTRIIVVMNVVVLAVLVEFVLRIAPVIAFVFVVVVRS